MERIFLLLVALVAVFALRFFLRRFLKQVGAQAIARQPDAIHLQPTANPAWRHPAAVEAIATTLLARGFIDVGAFAAPEMPQLIIRMFAKPDAAAYSCIYEHAKAGVWMDLFTRYEDDSGFTFTNTRDRGLNQRPNRPIHHFEGMGAAELYEKFLRERPAGAMITLTAEQLPRFYEDSYAESLAWRKKKGVSADEVARVAASREKN